MWFLWRPSFVLELAQEILCCTSFYWTSMPHTGCLALHGLNPNERKTTEAWNYKSKSWKFLKMYSILLLENRFQFMRCSLGSCLIKEPLILLLYSVSCMRNTCKVRKIHNMLLRLLIACHAILSTDKTSQTPTACWR